jgi:NADH-quinone oxidoreductase subunit N
MPEAIAQIQSTAMLLLPEIILLASACILFLAGPLLVTDAGDAPPGLRHQWGFLSMAAIAVAFAMWYSGDRDVAQGALFQLDDLVWYTRGLTLSAGFILALLLWNQIDDGHAAEAHACLLCILVGTNLVAAADDLVSLFLALELVSIPTYVLLYLPRRERANREAAAKYFLLSVFSSAIMLYGMSWLYGISGSTNFAAISDVVRGTSTESSNMMPLMALAFLVAGLSFRITAVPFHFYAPDVFQGSTPSNAALLSFVPKIVGFIALLRVLPLTGVNEVLAGWVPNDTAQSLLALIAVFTMFVGNLMALRQTNLYRLMAYSSVAHAGYMLVGLAVGDTEPVSGTKALLFYLPVYGLMTIGVFALVSGIAGRSLDDLRGLSRRQPTTALLLAVCLLSLTGLPPAAGFFGKLNLFLAAWSNATTLGQTLAVLMALNAAISAWYYLRLIALMFLDAAPQLPSQASTQSPGVSWSSFLCGVLCTAGTIMLFVAPQWLWDILP